MNKLLFPLIFALPFSCFAGTATYQEYNSQCQYTQKKVVLYDGECTIKRSTEIGKTDPVFYVVSLGEDKFVTFDLYKNGKAIFDDSIPAKAKTVNNTTVLTIKGGEKFTFNRQEIK